MRLVSSTLLTTLLLAGSFAASEVVIRTKDGKSIRLPIAGSDITSIEFNSQSGTVSTPVFTGRWVGTYNNSLGGSGASTFVLSNTNEGISGSLDGDPFRNAIWDGEKLSWTFVANSNKVTYHCVFRFTGEKTGILSYAASGSRTYTGTVNNYVRQ